MVSHSPASRLGSPRLQILSVLAARGSAILRSGSPRLRDPPFGQPGAPNPLRLGAPGLRARSTTSKRMFPYAKRNVFPTRFQWDPMDFT